jgi:hypothetical protein
VNDDNLTLATLHPGIQPHVTVTTPASVVRGIVDALNRLHGDRWTKVTVRPPCGNETLWTFWTDDITVFRFDADTGKSHYCDVNPGDHPTHFFARGFADFTIEPVRKGAGGAS